MSTHVKDGLTIEHLVTAQMIARNTMHPIELVDDRCHTIVMVDAKGHVVTRPEARHDG